MKSLSELYSTHQGKVSQKWGIYLPTYDRLFSPYRAQPVRLLEVGVQNGGSLEIWSKYFVQAQKLIGCDINPACSALQYEDPRVAIVVGDANTDAAEHQITSHAQQFDIVIDDGSHRSSDIIKTFARYFPKVVDGGIFVAEDLHCSYWQEFEGGLHDPYSSMSFFKLLADVVNHEHWGTPQKRGDLTQGIQKRYGVTLNEEILSCIHSVEFVNSICVIRKEEYSCNELGKRIVTGQIGQVNNEPKKVANQHSVALDQSQNFWSNIAHPPGELLKEYERTITERDGQIASLNQSVSERDGQINALVQSTSWRITKPIRLIGGLTVRVRNAARMARRAINRAGGIKKAIHKAIRVYQLEGLKGIRRSLAIIASQAQGNNSVENVLQNLPPVTRPAQALLIQRVLIIAELSIPQCTKYRVTQKQQMLSILGIDCTVLSWTDFNACLHALSLHTTVIFYRTPGFPNVLHLINEAKRLEMQIFWEVDDLIFDRQILEKSRSVQHLGLETINQLLVGADLYRKAMIECGSGIASTTGLEKEMRRAGLNLTHVIENALDSETLELAGQLFENRLKKPTSKTVRIVYGSGTNTHNIDFEEAADGILAVLERFEFVHFVLIGKLDLSLGFKRFEDRIKRIPFCSYKEYFQHLSEADISIAPLEPTLFNDSKSNIKYIEASILGMPSVCSPSAQFTEIVQHGVNGYLAANSQEWLQAFSELVTDSALRLKIGSSARDTVLDRYHPDRVIHQQLIPIIGHTLRSKKIRILSVNIFYSPRSFGGATVVAEQVNRLIHESGDCEVYVFTSLPANSGENYSLRRYEFDGVSVFGVVLPDQSDGHLDYENPFVSEVFSEVLSAIKPDIVHLHSIQGLGVGVADECVKHAIPYLVTLHDAWWICPRQFMINNNGRYCGQRKIDLNVCKTCTNNFTLNRQRQERLRLTLEGAKRLLVPSRFFADLYADNGFDKNSIIVNKNGIRRPHLIKKNRKNDNLRFGYVGGNTSIKGIDLILKAFSELEFDDVELVVVDNTLNLGYSSFNLKTFAGIKNVTLVPAYTQNTIDDFFSELDVLLFPTQWKESFGLTVREALARSVWVIATDAGGVIEDIRPGRNGLIIPLDDQGDGLHAAILKSIEYLRNSKKSDKLMHEECPITFFEDQAEELINIYKGIVFD